jgi:choline dehydrogenase
MESFDYVVVGAGSAGCVVANRLTEDGRHTVLLLEAGGPDNHPLVRMPMGFLQALRRPELTWGYESEPEAQLGGRRIPVPRGKLLGGSSSINGMFHIRGHRRDFDDWRDRGCTGWGYADVLPYFRRSESNWRGENTWHGGSGPVQVSGIDGRKLSAEALRRAAEAAGHPYLDDYDAGGDNLGYAQGDVAIDARGRRSSTARAYLHPILGRRNLAVRTRAQARRVIIEAGRAVGLEYLQGGAVHEVRARREVVLCGGAYNSPQLLMLSGIGPGEELQRHGIPVVRHLPGVGANLVEHPRMAVQFDARHGLAFTSELRFDRAALSVMRWALTGGGPFGNQVCSGTVLLKTDPALDRPDVQLLCSPVRIDAHLWFPGIRRPKPHGFYITVCQLYEKSRGRVTLRSADPMEAPRIRFNLLSHPDDYATMRRAIRATRRLYATPPQADLVGDELLPGARYQSDDELDEAIREQIGITHHPVGTCAMGVDDDAVVDPQLRVHGVPGLRVADASVMPTIVGGNTNAASIMIGEKASDLILGRTLPPQPHA